MSRSPAPAVLGIMVAAALTGCGFISPPTPTGAPVATDPQSILAGVTAQLEELDGVTAGFEVREVATFEAMTVTATIDDLTEDRLLEVAEIARGSLAMVETGFRTRLEVYEAGELVFEADGLKPVDDQLTDDIRYLFAVSEATGVPFRLRSLEIYPEAPASRTIETISWEYNPELDWEVVRSVPDPSGNSWSRWRGAGMDVVGVIPEFYAEVLHELAAIGPLSYDLYDETGTIQLAVDDGGGQVILVGGTDVGFAIRGEVPFEQTAAWPVVLDVIRVLNGRTDVSFQYFDTANGGAASMHIGYCEEVWSLGTGNAEFFEAVLASGVAVSPEAGSGDCSSEG